MLFLSLWIILKLFLSPGPLLHRYFYTDTPFIFSGFKTYSPIHSPYYDCYEMFLYISFPSHCF